MSPSESSSEIISIGVINTLNSFFARNASVRSYLLEGRIAQSPTTGTQKFSVPILPVGADVVNSIIAGDGYAYVAYEYCERPGDGQVNHLALLRISSSGAYEDISIFDWHSGGSDLVGRALDQWRGSQPAVERRGAMSLIACSLLLALGGLLLLLGLDYLRNPRFNTPNYPVVAVPMLMWSASLIFLSGRGLVRAIRHAFRGSVRTAP